jgi:hypothetical protein
LAQLSPLGLGVLGVVPLSIFGRACGFHCGTLVSTVGAGPEMPVVSLAPDFGVAVTTGSAVDSAVIERKSTTSAIKTARLPAITSGTAKRFTAARAKVSAK